MDNNVILHMSPPVVKNGETSKEVRMHKFSCRNDESWKYMPQLLRRIEKFCKNYDTETKPEFLVELVSRMFATNSPLIGLWGGINDDEKLAGHVLVTVEQYCGEPYLLIMQAEVDQGVSHKIVKRVFDKVITWGKKEGIKKMHIVTTRLPEIFERSYKFEKRKTILVKQLIKDK